MPNKKLNPCPLCGKEVAKPRNYPSLMDQHVVLCGMTDGGCGHGTSPFYGKIESDEELLAIKDWNTRPNGYRVMTENGLKSCPHCDSKDIILGLNADKTPQVKCSGCGSTSGGYIKSEDAVTSWNTEYGILDI